MRFEGASQFARKLVCLKDLEAFSLELDKVDIDNYGKFGSNLIFEQLSNLSKLEQFHFSYEEYKFMDFSMIDKKIIETT